MMERGSVSLDSPVPFTSCCSSGPKQMSSPPWACPTAVLVLLPPGLAEEQGTAAADRHHNPTRALSGPLHGLWW